MESFHRRRKGEKIGRVRKERGGKKGGSEGNERRKIGESGRGRKEKSAQWKAGEGVAGWDGGGVEVGW
jgi:hypothetical protein